jgi:DNA-binding winged helix-turn-helix (wHTH) protein
MLQPRAFDLLLYLIVHRDRVVRSDELLDNIWRSHVVQLGSLAAAIARVRKAIGEEQSGVEQLIRTYPRVGYRFVAALKEEPEGC